MSTARPAAAGAGPSSSPPALQRPLPRAGRQVNGSSFAYLFAELIAYYQQRITTANDLENKCVQVWMSGGGSTSLTHGATEVWLS